MVQSVRNFFTIQKSQKSDEIALKIQYDLINYKLWVKHWTSRLKWIWNRKKEILCKLVCYVKLLLNISKKKYQKTNIRFLLAFQHSKRFFEAFLNLFESNITCYCMHFLLWYAWLFKMRSMFNLPKVEYNKQLNGFISFQFPTESSYILFTT